MRVWAVIPALNEREAIGRTLEELLSHLCEGAVVVDGGSHDGTPRIARNAGAHVIVEPRRGYGRAMIRGAKEAEGRGAEALLLLDGNGRVGATMARRVLRPVLEGEADVAVGSRPGSDLRPVQRIGNALCVEVIHRTLGVRYRDVGSVRAATTRAMSILDLDEPGYGWPLQLQIRAAKRDLRVRDVPITLGPRRGGRSKVAGTLRGTAGASLAFLRVLATECLRRS